jgi:hypothetical protein
MAEVSKKRVFPDGAANGRSRPFPAVQIRTDERQVCAQLRSFPEGAANGSDRPKKKRRSVERFDLASFTAANCRFAQRPFTRKPQKRASFRRACRQSIVSGAEVCCYRHELLNGLILINGSCGIMGSA